MDEKTPVENLPRVGPSYSKKLKRLGIETIGDLLYHFPFRYIDYSIVSSISQAQPGEIITIRGTVVSFDNVYRARGRCFQKAQISDSSGTISVIWFNQAYLAKLMPKGTKIALSGKVDLFAGKLSIVSPDYELIGEKESIHTGRLVPIYHETQGLSSKWLRSQIHTLIKTQNGMEEFIPPEILKKNHLETLENCIKQIHFPEDRNEAEKAIYRFCFEELFMLHLGSLWRRKHWQETKKSTALNIPQERILEFQNSLPFDLTGSQKKVIREIFGDLSKTKPMNRLLEGDVGSGKTIVAAISILVSFFNKKQSALMAPTEILAGQHYATLSKLLKPFGVKSVLLSGKKKTKEKFDLAIGTHALIYRKAKFDHLGLVVIDEQHRFGVEQRAELITTPCAGKEEITPHMLTMTATPIPRTVALTIWGDLDLSIIDELPAGRQNIKTWVVPPQKRDAAYKWAREQIINLKTQAYVVCPLIEESETLGSVKAVKTEFERLCKTWPDLKLGLLHGRLKSQEKERALNDFKNGQTQVLVSTPVVEVGIDVPEATIMIVEGAERFGLAQLHQLRGRVGRGKDQSYCLLLSENPNQTVLRRLKALETTHIGMKLAQLDLAHRGPGDILGTQQHGFGGLKMASFSDTALIEKTGGEAKKIISKLDRYPLLKERLKKYTIAHIEPN